LGKSSIAGTVGLDWNDDIWEDDSENNACYIHRLAVAKEYHGQNLGEEILNWAQEKAEQKGRKYLRLDVNINNKKLRRYYENQGFKLSGTKYFPDYNYTAALYQQAL